MFVLLIGLPGPDLGPPSASFPPIKCSSCGSISRLPTRALTPRQRRGQGSRIVLLSPCHLLAAGAPHPFTFAPNFFPISRQFIYRAGSGLETRVRGRLINGTLESLIQGGSYKHKFIIVRLIERTVLGYRF